MRVLMEWITGAMVGIEYATFPLEGHDIPKGQALIIDLAILRLIFCW